MDTTINPAALKAIETVKKLLTLAKNGATEAEAQSATEKAMALLAAHNISMSQIETGPEKRADNRFKGGLYPWQRTIWKAVADMNFCIYWTLKGTAQGAKFEHRVVGSKSNVIATEIMCEYLCTTTDRLGKEWARNRGDNIFSRATNSYKEGIADRLRDRLAALKRQREFDARRQEQEAHNAAKASGTTANAVTIFNVYKTEKAANDDYLYGEGYTARNLQRQAEAAAESQQRRMQEEQWRRDNPVEAAKKDAENAAWYADYLDKEAKKAARRKPRVPAAPKYKGDPSAYMAGHSKGGDIGLDQQVDKSKTRRIA